MLEIWTLLMDSLLYTEALKVCWLSRFCLLCHRQIEWLQTQRFHSGMMFCRGVQCRSVVCAGDSESDSEHGSAVHWAAVFDRAQSEPSQWVRQHRRLAWVSSCQAQRHPDSGPRQHSDPCQSHQWSAVIREVISSMTGWRPPHWLTAPVLHMRGQR